MADLLIWLTLEVVFGFLFYITGAAVLRVVTFGKSKVEFYSFSVYRDIKQSKSLNFSRVQLVGMLFYIVLLLLLFTIR
ncbi:hypothetical protein TDB9533_03780 [Thalassocella blandensis]|nr:hypothetical protein TDB9533_03780 [Thalassocella blandensis]